jgi:dipeptidyl aminopeptidase/acylaminoacyl peptidase
MSMRVLPLVLVLLAAGCIGPVRPPARQAAESLAYAILTETEILVVVGDSVKSAAVGTFERYWSQMDWSGDGRYVVVASGSDPAERVLTVMDTRDGTVKRLPCAQCQTPAGLPGSRAVLADSQHALSIVELAGGTLSKLPSQVRFYSLGLRVLDAAGDRVLVAGADEDMVAAYGGPEDLYEVKLSGDTTPLGSSEANVPVSARYSPDGRRIALITGAHGGACAEDAAVKILSPQGGPAQHVERPAMPVPEPGAGGAMGPFVSYQDLWWEADGRLYAIVSSWLCEDTGGPSIPETPRAVTCLFDGSRWTLVESVPSSHVVLKHWRDGTLTIMRDGRPVKVAADAIDVVVA